ncbi:hypothetical protein FTUN_3906 [Frigoriglobus tundricola]|uniref:Uncharacterized protein n=1 Tax=Frigoriglobus tundricola TaxID=2774151 RepID=A0A6M5YQT3_9BACT|nr:hypothetical protein FTUN_3906 [Frigoriglobus tundricola]
MDRPLEPATDGRRMPLIVVAILAVLVSLGFMFAWPW